MTRDDGKPAQVGDWWWIENGLVYFAPSPSATVPNRLYGAEVNEEGEVV